MAKLPEYLASISYQNPTDQHRDFFKYAKDTDLNMFEWLEAHPEQHAVFSEFQSASAAMSDDKLRSIFKSLLSGNEIEDATPKSDGDQEVLLVDVGGGRGKTLREVRKEMPNVKGRVIVQDLPKVIEGHETGHEVAAMPYDIFTPQPVKGEFILLPPERSDGVDILSFH